MDQANYGGIYCAPELLNAGELRQYAHCLTWMLGAIPCFLERNAPLYKLLDMVYGKVGRRTYRAIGKLNLRDLRRTKNHSTNFVGFQEQLQNVVKTAYRDLIWHICIQSDASDTHCAAAVTQSDERELKKLVVY